MSDPRHPVQPAPVLPRSGGGVASPAVAPAARPLTAPPAQQHPHAQPQLHPQQHPQLHPQPAQRIPQAQPAVAPVAPRVAAPAVVHPAMAPAAPHAPASAKPQAAAAVAEDDAISLVEDAGEDDDLLSDSAAPAGPSKIKFGADIGIKKHAWKRQLKQGGMAATRVRTFHGKLSDQGLEYIDEAINMWLDEHQDVDVKFVTTNVGMFDGKFKDLALIVNVWY